MCDWLKETLCKDYRERLAEAGTNIEAFRLSLNECQAENTKLKAQLAPVIAAPPAWLDTSATDTYKPSIQVEGINLIMINPCDIYATSITLELIAKEGRWADLGQDAKLDAIWRYVINALTYAYDQSENWQFPVVTVRRRQGDCEDGSILFITLCKLAKVPADRAFNCVGYWNGYYHSFPIAQKEDGFWYVFESTLDFYPSSGAMLFKGSNYEASGGVSNWQFAGGIKGATKQV